MESVILNAFFFEVETVIDFNCEGCKDASNFSLGKNVL